MDSRESILQEIEQQRQLLLNYESLASDMEDDPAYVARGNGFCDTKYSDDFLQLQIAQLTARAADLRKQIEKK